MLIDSLHLPIPLSLMNRQTSPLPTVRDLARHHAEFVRTREAIALTRTPHQDITRAIPEIDEAAAEMRHGRLRKGVTGKFAEEVADVGIYLLSLLDGLGVTPEYVEAGLQKRLEERPITPTRRRDIATHKDNLALLEARAHNVRASIDEGPHTFECRGCHHAQTVESALDMLHQVWVTGKSVDPSFEETMYRKLVENDKRFTADNFAVPEGMHPQQAYLEAYVRRKMQEGWSLERALMYVTTKLIEHPDFKDQDVHIDPARLFSKAA